MRALYRTFPHASASTTWGVDTSAERRAAPEHVLDGIRNIAEILVGHAVPYALIPRCLRRGRRCAGKPGRRRAHVSRSRNRCGRTAAVCRRILTGVPEIRRASRVRRRNADRHRRSEAAGTGWILAGILLQCARGIPTGIRTLPVEILPCLRCRAWIVECAKHCAPAIACAETERAHAAAGYRRGQGLGLRQIGAHTSEQRTTGAVG